MSGPGFALTAPYTRAAVGPRERIGVFGGTFDPVHHGHLAAADSARDALGLSRVLLVPAGDPWQKSDQVVASARARLALVEAAVADLEGLEASAIEVDRAGPSYTIDTLEEFQAQGVDPVLIVGADVARTIPTWHRAEELARIAAVVVVTRAGADVAELEMLPLADVVAVEVPRLDISSTELRARFASHGAVAGLLPAAVIREIRERHLYTPE